MKLENAKISILIGAESTTIEIKDSTSATTFVKVKLTPEQLSEALSRTMYTQCEAEVFGLDKIGKVHENKKFEFEIPKEISGSKNSSALNQKALKALKAVGMDEWVPDRNYSSQDSFFTNGDKRFARVVIRRWIEKVKAN